MTGVLDFKPDVQLCILNILSSLFYWSHISSLCSEASAKTKDGVQCAFEELVEKILQTPGLWESDNQGQRIQLGDQDQARGRACGGYCSIPWNWPRHKNPQPDHNDYGPQTREDKRKREVEVDKCLFLKREVHCWMLLCCLNVHCSLHNYSSTVNTHVSLISVWIMNEKKKVIHTEVTSFQDV